jgi:hypothetical protein
MGLLGVRAVHTRDVSSFEEMVEGQRMALRHQLAKGGDRVIVMAGIPFATPITTNVPMSSIDRRRAGPVQPSAAPCSRPLGCTAKFDFHACALVVFHEQASGYEVCELFRGGLRMLVASPP